MSLLALFIVLALLTGGLGFLVTGLKWLLIIAGAFLVAGIVVGVLVDDD